MKKSFHFFYRPSRLGSHAVTTALAVLLTGAPLLADSASPASQASSTSPRPQLSSASDAADFAWLTQETRQWVASQEGVQADAVVFQALDKRITASPCAEPLAIDKPFGGSQTLRVRCLSGNWQVFLQRADGGRPRAAHEKAPTTAVASGKGMFVQTQHGKVVVRSESTASHGPQAGTEAAAPARAMPSRAESEQIVVVAKQNLVAGQPLEPGAFALEKRVIQGNPGNFFLQADGLEFSELMRDVKAGEPIRQRDLKKAVLVKRNHVVQLLVSSTPGLQITVQLQSLDDGRIGDQVRLKNPDSGKVMSGLVVGRNMAKSL
ncbi:MAG: flagellar basal body P-ring formation chaperone FlgA [Burkholderiaceae bacterium]